VVVATPAPVRGGGWRAVLLFSAVFLVVTLTLVFAIPVLLARWRVLDGQAEAEVQYAKRRAELRAEADEAQRLLDTLDPRVKLTTLGFRAVVRKVTPNIVYVTNLSDKPPPDKPSLDRPKMPPPKYHDPETDREYFLIGVGAGVLVKPGYVLTNHHVIRGASRLRVVFASGQHITFDVAGHVFSDRPTDLAVVRLPPEPPARLRPDYEVSTEFADSDRDVMVGDFVLAVGSPLGLKQTVTHGIISAKGRQLDRIARGELLQTDAAVNPGNSGGALFNHDGKLVGVVVAIASESGRNEGIAFAIPSNTARTVFEQLAAQGEVTRGFLGVGLDDLTRDQARALGLTKRNIGGVRVMEVLAGQPAQGAGLKPGDVIIGYENELLDPDVPRLQLMQWIMEQQPQQQVTLEILRGDQQRQVQLRLGKRPAE
jgi:S1-C subfamily serine protease